VKKESLRYRLQRVLHLGNLIVVHQSLVVKIVQCVKKLHEEVMCLCCFTCRNDKLCHLTIASIEVHLSEDSLAKEQYSSTCLMLMLVRGASYKSQGYK
jgi:hypothetical protein